MKRFGIWLLALLLALAWPPLPSRAEPVSPEEQAVLTELFILNRTLQEVQGRILRLQSEAEQAGRDLVALEAEQVRLEQVKQERQEAYGRRLRYYHENGQLAPVGVLLSSESFPDFLERLEVVYFLMQRDARLVSDLRSLKEQLEAQELAAAERREAAIRLAEEAKREEERLAREIDRKEAILASLQERRADIEAQLAALERAWETAAMPVLESLGLAMLELDVANFVPDSVNVTIFPPGANIRISEGGLNRFFAASPALKGLTFKMMPDAVVLEGQYQQVPVRVSGRFAVSGKTVLRYEPLSMEVSGFAVPQSVTNELMAEGNFDVDMAEQVSPFVLQEVRMREGEMLLRAGLR